MEAVAFKLSCWRGAVLLPSAARLSRGEKKNKKKITSILVQMTGEMREAAIVPSFSLWK